MARTKRISNAFGSLTEARISSLLVLFSLGGIT